MHATKTKASKRKTNASKTQNKSQQTQNKCKQNAKQKPAKQNPANAERGSTAEQMQMAAEGAPEKHRGRHDTRPVPTLRVAIPAPSP
jgi:hypothetical protein